MNTHSYFRPMTLVERWVPLICALMLFGSITAHSFETNTVKEIDVERSTMTVRVFKAGLFSAFGHNHEIKAPIAEGRFSKEEPGVMLRVHSTSLRVVDKDVSEKDRAEIQTTMLGPQVLDSQRFPEISFKSTAVQRQGDGKYLVLGDLTLHGETRRIQVQVEGDGEHYRGSAQLKQKDFGITPVTVAGGAVKVKNEVKVEFDIFGK
jgi:polyisoprenoid-binding protein YceI